MPSVIEQLQARVQQGLAHFPELLRAIPEAELRSPAHLRAWLSAAATLDKKGAQRASFGELSEAVDKWQAASGLVDRVTQLYNNGKVQRLAGDRLDWFMQHPSAAYDELLNNPKLARELGSELTHEIKLAALEARGMQEAHGVPEAREGPAPIPADAGSRRAEYDALLKQSVENRRKFDPEKRQRLEQLAGLMAGGATSEEAAAHRKALGIPEPTKPTGEYANLIDKSVSGGRVSETEAARMEELATDRAAAAGLFDEGEEAHE